MNGRSNSKKPTPEGGITILAYHSIANYSAPDFRRFVVHPNEFNAQMGYLSNACYNVISVADYIAHRLARRPLPEPSAVLTFDDAFDDFYRIVLPILIQKAFGATLYVPTGYVGQTARWLEDVGEGGRKILSWQALSEISTAKVEVASHSHTHPQLDRLPATDIKDEMRRSKYILEDKLGISVTGLAYPFGYWSQAARAAASSAGYTYACEVGELMATPHSDIYSLPRLSVNAGLGVSGLIRLLETRSTWIDQSVMTAKRITWRALRYAHAVKGDPRVGWTDQSDQMETPTTIASKAQYPNDGRNSP